ncbi:hypothetical protein [Kitasatospora aureofaciens]|uniref:hypothetical protein n=1 Tax=Kitasatospora aureofaciens TaxID=1894 RepID=UPI0037C6CB51
MRAPLTAINFHQLQVDGTITRASWWIDQRSSEPADLECLPGGRSSGMSGAWPRQLRSHRRASGRP